jgi:hypothetical protein
LVPGMSLFTRLMPGFWNGPISSCPVKSSVAIETLESNQSHYIIFVFIGELTNWPVKFVSRNRPIITWLKNKITYLTLKFTLSIFILALTTIFFNVILNFLLNFLSCIHVFWSALMQQRLLKCNKQNVLIIFSPKIYLF